jgi:hypothetical protein
LENFERVRQAAVNLLPNANILNIISKADREPYKGLVLDMFRTDELFRFKFDDKSTNFLYMNGVIEPVEIEMKSFMKFANPFVQNRLFNYFSNELFNYMGRLVDPMDSLEDAITNENLNIKNIIKRYQKYLEKNKHWLLKRCTQEKRFTDLRGCVSFQHIHVPVQFPGEQGGKCVPGVPYG